MLNYFSQHIQSTEKAADNYFQQASGLLCTLESIIDMMQDNLNQTQYFHYNHEGTTTIKELEEVIDKLAYLLHNTQTRIIYRLMQDSQDQKCTLHHLQNYSNSCIQSFRTLRDKKYTHYVGPLDSFHNPVHQQ